MLDLRTRLFLMIGGGALLIVLIIVTIILGRGNTSSSEEVVVDTPGDVVETDSSPTSAESTGQIAPTTPAPVPQTAEEKQALYLRQISRDFVERFLTYTNKNNNAHLADVENLVTPTMLEWVKTQALPFDTTVKTQVTKVISTTIKSITADAAQVEVGIQQTNTEGETKQVSYKKGRVDIMRIGNEWKINGVFWDNP